MPENGWRPAEVNFSATGTRLKMISTLWVSIHLPSFLQSLVVRRFGMWSVILFVIRNGQGPRGEGGYHLQWKGGGGLSTLWTPIPKQGPSRSGVRGMGDGYPDIHTSQQ